MWTISVPDTPIPLQRARSSKGRFYDPQYDVKKRYAAYFMEHVEPKLPEPLVGIITLQICFYFTMPKSWSMTKRTKMNMKYHGQKPDLTNCIKMIEDALNGIAWRDDSQIANIIVEKRWSIESSTELKIYEES